MNHGGGGRRGFKVSDSPLTGRKERDNEDLHLFKELHRRGKDRTPSLLLSVSDDFESNSYTGNFSLHRMSSAKKGSGLELLSENHKHDYDWLKTPPATPLFPSLEMEASAPQLVVQRELPIITPQPSSLPKSQLQPQTKDSVASLTSNGRSKSPTSSKPKVPLRSITPSSQRSKTQSNVESKNLKTNQSPIPNNQFRTTQAPIKRTNPVASTTKPSIQKEIQMHTDLLASNLSKTINVGTDYSRPNTKPRSRATSPAVRSSSLLAAQIPDFSNETPRNLITTTDRSTSATRGRPVVNQSNSASQKPDPTPSVAVRRQSCSPSVARGRKFEVKKEESTERDMKIQKKRSQTGNNGIGSNLLGSRMVDRLMNARKSGIHEVEKEPKPKARSLINESYGVQRMMPKGSVSADKALKQMVHRR